MHIVELDLSPAAFAALRAARIHDVDDLVASPADRLVAMGVGPHELFEIVCQLNDHDLTLRASRYAVHLHLPNDRDREMFRMRVIDGLMLIEVGERVGLSRDRVRQLVRERFGLSGDVPTVKARRWAQTVRRRLDQQRGSL
jgi:hypothetical protein